jgi:hypothetical protein
LGLTPAVLLVPAALEFTAKQILVSEEISRIASQDQLATGNPYRDSGIIAVAEPRLDADSATSWYLCSLPMWSAFIAAFLDGRQGCVVEEPIVPHDVLGISYRAYMDVGVALGEHRASIKSTA